VKPSLAVFLHSDRYDRVYQAVGLVLTASSMGWPCHLFLFYGALGSYLAGAWDVVNIAATGEDASWINTLQGSLEADNLPSCYDMLEKARGETGGVRVYACSASCKALRADVASVRERVDEVVGLPTMLRIAEEARHVLYV
jgi:peroxiredoxin family protein